MNTPAAARTAPALVMTAERTEEPHRKAPDRIEDTEHDPAAESDPRPHPRVTGRLLRAGDVAGGKFRVDLRGENNGNNAERKTAAERHQDGRNEVVVDSRLRSRNRR